MNTSPTPDPAEVEALTEALYADAELGPGYMFRDDCEHLALRILASDWLAERDRRNRREAVEAVVASVVWHPKLLDEWRRDANTLGGIPSDHPGIPGLYVYTANRLCHLIDALSDALDGVDVHDVRSVTTPVPGHETWLKARAAALRSTNREAT